MICHDHLPGLPACSSLVPIHPRWRHLSEQLSRADDGRWIGSIHTWGEILILSIELMTDAEKAEARASIDRESL